ncbi:YgaB family protein [Bacillus sp. Marseille-Q1617]|uniref:YgaB family protein n=1 Tax=Bacillus sp. Marseille-Q1617 TaxID=2736887 RepID=UPI00158953A5|nr:YgaB family protein [Bacillus sp. Marseille-Q1617]
MQQRFNQLVSEQLATMDKLLFLQAEIERCQKLEGELIELQEMTKVQSLKSEIIQKKRELKEIHRIFQEQTDDVIRSYQEEYNEVPS